jgi:hypothetical protein
LITDEINNLNLNEYVYTFTDSSAGTGQRIIYVDHACADLYRDVVLHDPSAEKAAEGDGEFP